MGLNPSKLAAFANQQKKPNNGPFPPKNGKPNLAALQKKGYGKNGDDHNHDDHGDNGEDKRVDVDAVIQRVASGKGDPHLMQLAKGVSDENNPPQWAASEDVWEKAKKAVEPKWDDLDEPYAVVAHVYQQMGGQIKGGGKDHEHDNHEDEHDEPEDDNDYDE